ncbi:MAG: hypothetical protein AAF231_02315 [Pseudomonadota bacterium]
MRPSDPADRRTPEISPHDGSPGRRYADPYEAAREDQPLWRALLTALAGRIRGS